MGCDVIAVGSASIDVFVKTEARIIDIKGTHHGDKIEEKLLAYPLGSKILVQQLAFVPGGAGTNVCATFVRLGLETAFVGVIGNDIHGQTLQDWLHEQGIAFLGQTTGETGYSVILSSQADDRTILSFKGCNNDLEFNELPLDKLTGKWIYGTSMLGKSFEAQQKLFVFAKKQGGRTAYNPNPYMCSRGLSYLKTILEHTDVLILNREEAELLVGKGTSRELAQRLSEQGPEIITVSDGARGATVYATPAQGGECWHIMPAPDIAIVDTTGAGDAFGSSFVGGLMLQKSLLDAGIMGVLNAESVIQVVGAKNYLADRETMNRCLQAEHHHPRHEIRAL